MRLKTIHTGNFMLDGGAMFGTVPKSIWKNINPADDNNMCNWAMRCLLVEDGNRLILIDNGMGEKQSEKFFGYYYLNGIHSLQKSLNEAGVDFGDITDVILTHLHFDHCGGSVKWNTTKDKYELTFPNPIAIKIVILTKITKTYFQLIILIIFFSFSSSNSFLCSSSRFSNIEFDLDEFII